MLTVVWNAANRKYIKRKESDITASNWIFYEFIYGSVESLNSGNGSVTSELKIQYKTHDYVGAEVKLSIKFNDFMTYVDIVISFAK